LQPNYQTGLGTGHLSREIPKKEIKLIMVSNRIKKIAFYLISMDREKTSVRWKVPV
jgi:hypothetical protein